MEIVQLILLALETIAKVAVNPTLGLGEDADLNLMLDSALQEFFCEQAPAMFAPLSGGCGRMGITVCDLKAADEPTFLSALKAAHALAQPAPKKGKRTAKRS